MPVLTIKLDRFQRLTEEQANSIAGGPGSPGCDVCGKQLPIMPANYTLEAWIQYLAAHGIH